MLPFDPIASLIVVVGVFAYFTLKGSFSSKKEDKGHEDFIKWFREQEEKRSPDNCRYQNWLYDHRQK
jgi:hypothetical protein